MSATNDLTANLQNLRLRAPVAPFLGLGHDLMYHISDFCTLETLKTLNLVCKSTRHFASPLVFRHVLLKGPDNLEEFVESWRCLSAEDLALRKQAFASLTIVLEDFCRGRPLEEALDEAIANLESEAMKEPPERLRTDPIDVPVLTILHEGGLARCPFAFRQLSPRNIVIRQAQCKYPDLNWPPKDRGYDWMERHCVFLPERLFKLGPSTLWHKVTDVHLQGTFAYQWEFFRSQSGSECSFLFRDIKPSQLWRLIVDVPFANPDLPTPLMELEMAELMYFQGASEWHSSQNLKHWEIRFPNERQKEVYINWWKLRERPGPPVIFNMRD
ncbi:hypothetical protein T439DRAFT_383121 [Meredithblackwellia eburnea MCA 4105]